jgi:hypothetical protein
MMTTRHNRVTMLTNRNTNGNAGPWGFQIGHPCGFIATSRHLRSRPRLSKAVGDFLLADASMSGDFEDMLMMMSVYKLKLSKRVKLHLKHWVALGCPTHKENHALSKGLVWLYTFNGADAPPAYYVVRDMARDMWAATNRPLPIDCDGEPIINFDAAGDLITA